MWFGIVALLIIGIVFHLLGEDNPFAMFAFIPRAFGFADRLLEAMGVPEKWVTKIEIGVIAGLAFTMMQIGEHFAAIILWLLLACVWVAKACTWPEGLPRGITVFLRVAHVTAALLVCGFLIVITTLHRGDDYWSNLQKFWEQPSFAYLAPGVVLNDNTWDFVVRHKGRYTNKSVEVFFVDAARSQKLAAEHTKSGVPLTREDIDSYTRFLNIPEVNPLCRGHAFAIQLLYSAPDFEHEHYSIEISSDELHLQEDLRVERVAGKWYDEAEIKNVETGKTLLKCRDRGFPNSKPSDIACFPAILDCNE